MGLLGASYQCWELSGVAWGTARGRADGVEDLCQWPCLPLARAALRAFTRQPGRRCCPASASRRGTRVPPPLLVPGGALRAGPARAEECQPGLSTRVASGERPAAALASPWQNAVGSHHKCRTDECRTVLSIIQTDCIDLDTLDAVAQLLLGSLTAALAQSVRIENASAAALRKKWATAAARRGTRAAAPTAARTARTELILRPATPFPCAVGGSPTTPASRGSSQSQSPSASRRRSRAPSASSTSS